jgi:large subunit ribosomal protein L14e
LKPLTHELGRVVLSKQGHDKGKAFLVVGLADEKHVLIADGDSRKLAKPKKKQAKHLIPKPFVAAAALDAILRRAQTADSDIRKALKTYRDADD